MRSAVAGETYINPQLGARMVAEATLERDDLTPREIEVLGLVALGYMNEIAERLVLSVRTVEHRANIQRKTGLTTRAELVAYALDHDLVER